MGPSDDEMVRFYLTGITTRADRLIAQVESGLSIGRENFLGELQTLRDDAQAAKRYA